MIWLHIGRWKTMNFHIFGQPAQLAKQAIGAHEYDLLWSKFKFKPIFVGQRIISDLSLSLIVVIDPIQKSENFAHSWQKGW